MRSIRLSLAFTVVTFVFQVALFSHLARSDCWGTAKAEKCYTEAETFRSQGYHSTAQKLYKEACDGGSWNACVYLGWQNIQFGMSDKGIELYQRACDHNFAKGCHYLGTKLWSDNKISEAKLMLEKACGLNYSEACRSRALLGLASNDEQDGKKWAELACKKDGITGCELLALGLLKEFKLEGMSQLKSLCDKKSQTACTWFQSIRFGSMAASFVFFSVALLLVWYLGFHRRQRSQDSALTTGEALLLLTLNTSAYIGSSLSFFYIPEIQSFNITLSFLAMTGFSFALTFLTWKRRSSFQIQKFLQYDELNIKILGCGVAIGLGITLLSISIAELIARFVRLESIVPFPELLKTVPLAILLISVVCPIVEEFMFRGMLQQILVNKFSPQIGIVASAVIFSISHMNPAQISPTLIAGLCLGWLAYRSNSLVLPILIHAQHNTTALVLELLSGRHTNLKSEVLFQSKPVLALGLFMGAALIALGIFAIDRMLSRMEATRTRQVPPAFPKAA